MPDYDMAVVQTAYVTAVQMEASDKVLLALFEAGIVESGFRNLPNGPDDSKGYLQQRPSQGWPNPMDVKTATSSFVAKARSIENDYPTSGMLAQAVQRSAFPLKYDAVRAQAMSLIAQVHGANGGSPDKLPYADQSNAVKDLLHFLSQLSNPTVWLRVGIALAGIALAYVGLMRLTGAEQKIQALGQTAEQIAMVIPK